MIKIKCFSFILLSLIVFSCGINDKISFNDLFEGIKKEFNNRTFEGVTKFGEVKKSGETDVKKEQALYLFDTESLKTLINRNEVVDTFSFSIQSVNSNINVENDIVKNKIKELFEITNNLKIENYEMNALTGEYNFYFYLADVTDLPIINKETINKAYRQYGVLTYAPNKETFVNSDVYKKYQPIELESNWYLYYF